MGLIIDSSVAIAAERMGRTPLEMLAEVRGRLGEVEIGVSVITVMELAHGEVRSESPPRRERCAMFLNDLLSTMGVHPVTASVALRAGRLDGGLQAKGIRVSVADLLIGATALELGDAVLTHNVRHFRAIPNLVVQQV